MRFKYKALYFVSAIICLAIFFGGRESFVKFLLGTPKNKVAVSTLQAEFSKIKIRGGDAWSSLPQSFDKSSIAAVSGHLKSKAPVGDIFRYYRDILPQLGWIESGSKNKYGEQTVKFCKNGMSLNIVATSDAAGVDYYLGVAWASTKGLDAYCPQVK